ncbi:MAG TPA: PhzF family phenazine biosynthesis protein [Bellilinea sp.]|nr:PhzF family phenazine biosynthesis protein [Bellilinea sp.]
MTTPLFQVDSFTDRPFVGNPAGVCVLAAPQDDDWLVAVAREMNLSETAFLLPLADHGYNLRWFTPLREVSLCGHATLAAAHILWQQGYVPVDQQAVFDTLSGKLTAYREAEGWIRLDFPARQVASAEPPPGLMEAIGARQVQFVGRYRNSNLIEVAGEEDVRAVTPDFSALLQVEARSVIVTARSTNPAYDFVSRYFAPAVGVNEDPVTGTAHCALATYWGDKLGKSEMTAYQASARGGFLRVRPRGERVELLGQAVTIFAGELKA